MSSQIFATSSMASHTPRNPHVGLLAGLGMGHLTPAFELAKRLVAQHGLAVTFFAVTNKANQAEDELLQSATSSLYGPLNIVILTPQFSAPPPEHHHNADVIDFISYMVSGTLPALRSYIASMKMKPTALILDALWTEAISIANEFNMRKYVLTISNAWFLSYLLYLPYLSRKPINRDEPFDIPGCEPIPGGDLVELTLGPDGSPRQEFIRIGLQLATLDGILVNTWEELESKTVASFRDERYMKQMVQGPVYAVGPLVRMHGSMDSETELMRWLDHQPDESVVYVAFGGAGTLSHEQTIEMAWGLELSQQRFVWVIRPPTKDGTVALPSNRSNDKTEDELLINENDDLLMVISKYLPDGFIDRTRDVGIVLPMWAPQEQILSHRSIGGFLSHCGWNSILESIVNGVPIIAWPLYAEHDMIATMVTNHMKIAIRSRTKPNKGLTTREEIRKLVTTVMVDEDGIKLRKRVEELKTSANIALNKGGSSFSALSKLAQEFEANVPHVA